MNCQLPPAIVGFFLAPSLLSKECALFLNDKSLNGIYGITIKNYLILFLLTCLFEAPFYFWVLRHLHFAKRLFALFLLNIATHPLVVLGFPQFFALSGFSRSYSLTVSELFAPLFEFAILVFVFNISWKKGFLISSLANVFSWGFGGWLVLKVTS